MDSFQSAHDIIKCDLCKKNIVQNYCDFCHVNLCKPCIGGHISDEYDIHKIVPIQERKFSMKYPICKVHLIKPCELQCKSCDAFICNLCVASNKHKGHDFLVLENIYKIKKMDIDKDAEDIENVIRPTYKDIRNELIDQIARLDGDYKKITTGISEQGKKWHTEIDRVVNKMTNEIMDIKENHRGILRKHLDEIKQIESLIGRNFFALKEVKESNDVSLVVEYRPRNKEFRKVPAKVHVSLPTFCPKPINGEQVNKMFGSIKPLLSTSEEGGYKMKLREFSSKGLLDEPTVINAFNTGYNDLRSISFCREEEIWTSASSSEIKCFSTDGKLIKTITTKSGEWPSDIEATNAGDLVYCDFMSKTIMIKMKDGKTEELIRLHGWTPNNMCVTSNDDVLVSVYKDDGTQSKVVRYSGSTEKQTIQFDNEGIALFSGNYNIKYITENRNHDICVADCEAGAVVVVNQTGKRRWRYTGHSSEANKTSFQPHGITTNSQSHILTADYHNHCIHILDQDGQFLCYIDKLNYPYSLCVDELDNMYVAQFDTGDVKVIRCLM